MDSPIRLKSIAFYRMIIFVMVMIGCGFTANAQIKKGEKLMSEGAYSEAIKPLKKDFYGKDRNVAAGILLAKCYYQLRDYQEASDVLSQIDPDEMPTADDRRFLSDVFIVNDDFSSAYINLIQLLSEDQSDKRTLLWLDKVGDLLKWDSIPNFSNTEIVTGINSIYNEYAPYLVGDEEMWYVSDVAAIQTVFPASYNNQNLHLYYKTKLKSKSLNVVSRPSMLFKKRDYYYHDGPIARWNENTYALTLRDIEAPNGKLGIYFSTLSGVEEDIKPFKYNEKYNTAHPTFTKNGSRIIFSSDRPGGYGQMDLWYSDYINDEWTEPKNMGAIINTPFSEVFPTYYKGRIYFSSDRTDMGYGALDVYYASEIERYNKVTNLRAPVNSAYDDFGLTFLNTIEGYFSSNRKPGVGGDDIYAFTYSPEKLTINEITFEFLTPVLDGTIIEVYNSVDSLITTTTTTGSNFFKLNDLTTGEIYKMKVADKTISKDTKIRLLSENGQEVNTFDQSVYQIYPFELTGVNDVYDTKPLSETELLTYAIMGKIIAEEGTQINGIPVSLKNSGGVLLGKSKTAQDGTFTINGAKAGEHYTIETEGLDVYHEIDIYGNSGAITQSLVPSGQNRFAYTRAAAPAMWMESESIKVPNVFAIVLNNENVENETITLFDEQDTELMNPDINEDGFMKLDTMVTGKAYRLNMPQRDFAMDDRLVILDGNGDTSQTVRPFDANNFFFEYLIYKDYGKFETDQEAIAETNKSLLKNRAGQSFKAVIGKYDLPENTAFILRSLNGDRTDTVYSNSKGVITLDHILHDLEYELELLDTLFAEDKKIELFDEVDDLAFEGSSENRKTFRFTLLEKLNSYLTKQVVADQSILKVLIAGNMETKSSSNAQITISDKKGNTLAQGYPTQDGNFSIAGVTPMSSYVITSADPDPDAVLNIKLPDSNEYVRVKRNKDGSFNVNMQQTSKPELTLIDENKEKVQVREGARFSLSAVYYEFNSYYLKQNSRNSLDKLVTLLKDNPELRIEIQSHTDSRGPANYNNMLSQKRADGVAEYLKKAGIQADRLETVGKGETELTNRCKDGVNCDEDEHAANRRTEFIILGNDKK